MINRLYNVTDTANLGWWPSVNIMPITIEGLRVLALEALRVDDFALLDRIELAAIAAIKIQPESNDHEKAEPIGLFHGPAGIVVRWRCFTHGECPACEGTCELSAFGRDGVSYDCECPNCSGTGTADDAEESYVDTDIDGHLLASAG